MTCSLNTFGKIIDLETIVEYLDHKESIEKDKISTKDLSDSESEAKNRIQESKKIFDSKFQENWFDKFHVNFSPCGNLFVLSSNKNIVICMGKWDMTDQIKFSISSKLNLYHLEDEIITSVLCLPVASQRISGEGILDWTCILVGFNNGNIRMYTENGTLLITQMFHNTKILKIKCKTYENPKYTGWISQPEEIDILYENNILVSIDGANLYHYLRAARKYAATMPGDYNDIMESISSMSLDYKKWKFDSQELLTDFVSAGLTSDNRFDQIFAASMIGGPNEIFESIPPLYNRYIACGNSPFVSIYYALDDLSQPMFTEVRAVAGKITSSLMSAAKGWMGFGKSTINAKPKPKIEPPTPLGQRIGLQDFRRNGETIIISPANNLAATTDSYGRVMLIDVPKGIAIRIFKGYRDAQIGWICVDDESEEKLNNRYALYLVIYAPRRGLVEIWGCQQGIRVAAFNVGKNCRLIYPGYFMLSLNGNLYNNEYKISQQIQCFLVNSEGLIKTLNIPFHLILSDKNNQRVRDTILLKKLKSILRENKIENDALWQNLKLILADFRTPTIKQQALEKILNTDYFSYNKIYDVFIAEDELIKKQGNNQSPESLKYGEFCNLNCLLIQSYIFLNNIDQNLIPDENNKDEESINELLQVNENQIIEYFELKKKLSSSKKVKFRQTEIFNLPKFLSCFDPTPIELSQSDQSKITFEFNKAISDDDKEQLGSLVFSNLLKKYNRFKIEDLEEFFKMVPTQKIRLLDLLIHAMLNEGFTSIHAFYDLVFILSGCLSLNIEKSESSDTSDPVDHDFESIFINGFLPKFKNTIENSKNLINSLIVVWVIRSILFRSQIDNAQIDAMNTLIERINSLIKLNLMFSCGSHSVLHSIDFDFNIRNILNRGRGIFSELTSRHVVLNGYPPKLMNLFDVETDESNSPNEEQKMLQNHDFKLFYDALQDGRKFLPKSLESDTLLVNCAWESILMYEKEVEKGISYLDLALKFCSEIGNAILRQGILSIIWHKDLSKKIASLTKLIDKTGNLPNDKIVRSEVGIKEEHTVTFLTQIMNLLDLIMDANCNLNEVPIFNYDSFWKDIADYSELGFIPTNMILNLASGSSSPTDTQGKIKNSSNKQLVELAAEQKPVNYHLCLFQYQLIRILYLIVKYKMKSVKPFSFFDTKGKLALFSELHTHPLISNDVDAKIVNTRKLFFTKALNSIMKQVKNPTNIRSRLPEDVNESLATVFNLSKDMEVDSEFIKRYYCCLLYALDYHFEAEKILHGIKEVELFASQLLIVVGHKVNDILENNTNPNLIAILSTNLKSWLKSLGPPDYRIHTISSKQAFLELIGIVLHRLPESFSEYKIATEFLDFLENPLFKL